MDGHRVAARRAIHALRPDGTIRPDVNFAHRTDEAGLHDFHRAAQTILGTALVAHLRDDAVFLGQLAQEARFIDRLRQRFLAVNILAQLDGRRGHQRVHVIRGRNDDRIESLFLFEHHAPVLIKPGFRILLELTGGAGRVHVAQRHNVFAGAMVGVGSAFAVGPDDADVEFFRG